MLARRGTGGSIGFEARQSLERAGIRLIEIDAPSGRDTFEDEDGTYERWFAEHACHVAAVRPDFHVWGTASSDSLAIRNLLTSFAAFAATANKSPMRGPVDASPATEAGARFDAVAIRP